MSTADDNKAAFQKMYDEVNKGNNDAIDELLADDFVNHEGAQTIPSKQAFKEFQVYFATAFPDFNYQLDELVAEGDYVAVRATVSGTQKGEFMGVPPTNKHAVWQGSAVCHFRDGKLIERHHVADIGGMLVQLGVMPDPNQQ